MGHNVKEIETEYPRQWRLFMYAVADATIIERQKEAIASKNKSSVSPSGGGGRKVLRPPNEFMSRG